MIPLLTSAPSSGGGWPPATNTYQTGSKTTTVGSQGPYAVVFSPALTGAPSNIQLQPYMDTSSGEVIFATVEEDTVTANGFSFWLSAAPGVAGKVKWSAQI